MALEDSINTLNATIEKLIVVLSSGGSDAVNEALGGETKTTGRGRPAGSKNKAKEVLYFHQASHNNVYQVPAGETPPAVEGAVQITAEEFAKLKEQYQGNASAPAAAPAAAPAPAAQSPAAAPATQQTASASSSDGAPTLMDIQKRLGDLSKLPDGRDKIMGLFKTWDIPTFPALEPKIKAGALDPKQVMAHVEAQFAPAPAADPLAGLGL